MIFSVNKQKQKLNLSFSTYREKKSLVFKKGYILRDPDLSPIAKSFCTGSYASAVGECGNPCRKV